ncbi:MAG: DUF6084 family protein [Chloroflexota bacterium]|nr:DUF6084 family protein [Chloroflexota bacterium]
MLDLSFEVTGAEVAKYSVLPMLIFKMRIANASEDVKIHNVNLKCQIMLSVTQRRYQAEEKAKLQELFGEPARWGTTLRTFLWTIVPTVVPRFSGNTVFDLAVPCLYDFEVVSTKYFNALEDGDIPLSFLFSGTIFYEGEADNVQIAQISWSKEATYRLPVALWKEAIETSFPNSAWIRMHKDVFDQLYQYKITHGLPTWEDVLERLLQASSVEVQP